MLCCVELHFVVRCPIKFRFLFYAALYYAMTCGILLFYVVSNYNDITIYHAMLCCF